MGVRGYTTLVRAIFFLLGTGSSCPPAPASHSGAQEAYRDRSAELMATLTLDRAKEVGMAKSCCRFCAVGEHGQHVVDWTDESYKRHRCECEACVVAQVRRRSRKPSHGMSAGSARRAVVRAQAAGVAVERRRVSRRGYALDFDGRTLFDSRTANKLIRNGSLPSPGASFLLDCRDKDTYRQVRRAWALLDEAQAALDASRATQEVA